MNYIFLLLLIGCCGYALAVGGAPERIGAALYALACLASFLLVSAPQLRFRSLESGIFVIDLLLFACFAALALCARRFWPIWVTALAGLGVMGHLATWAGPEQIPWAYAVILSIWSYPILMILVVGTLAHRRRLETNGSDPSWSRFSIRDGPASPTVARGD